MAQGQCSPSSGNPMLSFDRNWQCSLRTSNMSLIEPCCTSNVQTTDDGCFMYCQPKADLRAFINCVSGGSDAIDLRTDAACIKNIDSKADSTITGLAASSAIHGARRPSLSALLMVALVTTLLLVVPASATTTNNNNNHHVARQSNSGCQLNIDSTSNSTAGRIISMSQTYNCTGGDFCTFKANITSDYLTINRTLNGRNAADPKWDSFFTQLGDVVTPARLFPATGYLFALYEWAAFPGTYTSVGFTPTLYCVNGTASNCNSQLHNFADGDNSVPFEACGQAFVEGTGQQGQSRTIAGEFSLIED